MRTENVDGHKEWHLENSSCSIHLPSFWGNILLKCIHLDQGGKIKSKHNLKVACERTDKGIWSQRLDSCIPNGSNNTEILLVKRNAGNVQTLILLHSTPMILYAHQPVTENGWTTPFLSYWNNVHSICLTIWEEAFVKTLIKAARMHLRAAQRGHVTWTRPEMSWEKPRLSSLLLSFNSYATQPLHWNLLCRNDNAGQYSGSKTKRE